MSLSALFMRPLSLDNLCSKLQSTYNINCQFFIAEEYFIDVKSWILTQCKQLNSKLFQASQL